ncbi:SIS domain-containing protein [Hydromonas duriensis]|nr:SIS domain-containing protein [Hydromonas duriensis]
MYQEAKSAAQAVTKQQQNSDDLLKGIAQRLIALSPSCGLTVARGSSDHAANYFAYLTMQRMGIPMVSLPMSLQTMYQAPLKVKGQFAVALSQSGKSHDLLQTMQQLRDLGAYTVGMVNDVTAPLGKVVHDLVALDAGLERSVAATKSYIASLTAAARLVAHWSSDSNLLTGLNELPEQLKMGECYDWSAAIPVLQNAERIMIVGRGLGFSIALEAALKLKETCGIQAEAFSAAEIKHGPMALVEQGYPLLVFAPKGQAQEGLLALATEMQGRGANVILAASSDVAQRHLTIGTTCDEALDPILAIQAFYLMAARLAEAKGLNPDEPRHLSKVTVTV